MKEKKPKIDPVRFWPSLLIILGVSTWLIFNPDTGKEVVDSLLESLTFKFDWLFEWTGFLIMGFLLWLALGRYGNIKLGKADDDPEFSTFSWISMLFCGGIGAALIYWAIIEPIYYLQGPPFGIAAQSAKAAEWSVVYGMFHWGFSAWAFYCLPAVVVAYSYYIKKEPQLKPSVCCRGAIGNYADGIVGKIIDILVILGLIGGVGTTLGINVPMISAVVSKIFNIPDTFMVKLVILIIWIALFGFSAYLGLYDGIQKLSNINVKFALGLVLFVLIVGPTFFILSSFTNSVGLLLQNFIRMSLWTDPINKGGFPQAWTVFYWAWWVAYAVYIGIFVARISKGRTIKELITAVCFCGTLGCWLYFAVFGAYAIHLEVDGILPVIDIMQKTSPATAIASVMESLPLSAIVLPIFVVVALIFQATTLDSAAYTLASITTKELHADEQPARWNRLFWALVLGVLSIALLIIGGLKAVQLSSVLMAIPVVIILILLTISLLKWLKEDFGEKCAPPERTLE